MGWRSLEEFVRELESRGELLRVSHPVNLEFEAGCIADRLVKTGGPAVIFDQPRLADGSISKFPLAMNLFGTRERTNLALGTTGWSLRHPATSLVARTRSGMGGYITTAARVG